MPTSRIVLDLDRQDISVSDFTEALGAQIKLVGEVMAEMKIPTNEVRWVVSELRSGSAYAAASPQVLGTHAAMADIDQAIKQTGHGLQTLSESAKCPKFFSEDALKLSRRLLQFASLGDAGRARLLFGAVSVAVSSSTEAIAANVETLVKGDRSSIGSIEGQLVRIEGTDGSYRIAIHDRLRNRKVQCLIKRDLLARALKAFDTRVVVRGRIWSRRDGTPTRIEVRQLEEMAAADEIPSWQEMRGILRDFRVADGD